MTCWYFLLILSIPDKSFSYASEGAINTNISAGEILEQNLVRVYNNSTNKYYAVENDTIIDYLTKSNGWNMFVDTTGKTQSLSKVFSFDNFPKSVKFSYLVNELVQMLNHHPIIHIDWDKVTIELNTWALNNSISNFDLRSAILLDQLYVLFVEDDL